MVDTKCSKLCFDKTSNSFILRFDVDRMAMYYISNDFEYLLNTLNFYLFSILKLKWFELTEMEVMLRV
jgi:hypothetical protein